MPAPEVKKQFFDSRQGYPACGVIFEVNSHDNQVIEQAFAKQYRQRVLCKALAAPAQGQAIDPKSVRIVSAFTDLRHTRQSNNPGVFMCPAERLRWMETISVYSRHGMPKVLVDFVLNVVKGRTTNMFCPIYVDPEAYPLEATRVIRKLEDKREREKAYRAQISFTSANLQKKASANNGTTAPPVQVNDYRTRVIDNDDHGNAQVQIDNNYERSLPPKAVNLQEQYYRKYGIFAPVCPVNDKQAKVYEDYHNEVLRSQVDVDNHNAKYLTATATYLNRMSERCDDGLDVLDAIKERRGQCRWIHPNNAESLGESGDEEGAGLPQPESASNVVTKNVSNAVNNRATNVLMQKPSAMMDNKRQRPQNIQGSHLARQPPAKKQKVQQSYPPAHFTSTLVPTQQQRPAK